MIPPFVLERTSVSGLSYSDFMHHLAEDVATTDPATLSAEARALHDYTVLNLHRSQRVEKTVVVPEDLVALLASLPTQTWLVVTEGWCGDSAQILPQIAMMAQHAPAVTLRILPRDSHPDVMDLYETDGARAIPKLVVWDAEGRSLFRWGPRPKEAQDLIQKLKNEGMERTAMYERLHLWYGRNRGAAVHEEFRSILTSFVRAPRMD